MRYIAVFLVLAATAPPQAIPPTIVGACIESVEPERGDVATRKVRLRLEVSAQPRCSAGAMNYEYGFLIDADRRRDTGVIPAALDSLGIDARVAIRCDQANARFVSSVGQVSVATDDNVPRLQVVTTVDHLPSVDFHWTPYISAGTELTLLRSLPRVSRWAIFERSVP